MDAPPDKEDSRPFLAIADHLNRLGFAAPHAIRADLDGGLILLEDFGDELVGPLLAREPGLEDQVYRAAIDIQVALHDHAPPAIEPYARPALVREVDLFTDWYLPALGVEVDRDAWHCRVGRGVGGCRRADARRAGADAARLSCRQSAAPAGRDGVQRLGLLDFQDALAGHPPTISSRSCRTRAATCILTWRRP
jgi:aminoglycoside/choline kinase family phosphotransferase